MVRPVEDRKDRAHTVQGSRIDSVAESRSSLVALEGRQTPKRHRNVLVVAVEGIPGVALRVDPIEDG